MRLPRLEMTAQYGRIQIDKEQGQYDIKSNHQVLNLDVSQAQVQVRGTLPRIEIDQTQAFAEAGLKNIAAMGQETVSYARSQLLAGIGRYAEQGQQLANPAGGNAIASQASYNAFELYQHEFGLRTVPTSGADIRLIRGELDIQVREGEVQNNTQSQRPEVNYIRGKINIYLQQKNSLTINVVDLYI